MKIAIIDDEPASRITLKTYLTRVAPSVLEMKEADSVESGLQLIQDFKPDTVFLDIQLHDLTGFDLLDRLENIDFNLIFVTAYDEYAIKAFDYAALHYILKPVDQNVIQGAIDRCLQTKKADANEKVQKAKEIYLRTENRSFRIDLTDVTAIVADGSYSKLFKQNGESVFVAKNLGEFEKELADNFFRAHKSVIINLDMIAEVDFKNNHAVLKDRSRHPVSRRKKPQLRKLLA